MRGFSAKLQESRTESSGKLFDFPCLLSRRCDIMKFIMQLLCLIVGIGLVLAWRHWAWGPAALMGGVFFAYIALMTLLIDLAGVPGFWQPVLRSAPFGIFQIVSIVALIIATAVVGVLQNMGFFG